jgi:hypothetical protein
VPFVPQEASVTASAKDTAAKIIFLILFIVNSLSQQNNEQPMLLKCSIFLSISATSTLSEAARQFLQRYSSASL